MSASLLIAIAFCLGFFIESIIGFGGGIIAYGILGFFIDVKEMILAGLYIGTCSSAYIVYSDHKNFARKIYFSALPLCFLGTVIGAFVFSRLSSDSMLSLLGGFLILLAIKTFFLGNIVFPKFLRNFLLLIGGVSHGLFGIGGPFIVNALRNDFKSKSELRTTIAAFFVTFNLVRIIQLFIQGQITVGFFFDVWWVVFPIFGAIYLGFKIHMKIDESLFKKLIAVMTFCAGLVFVLG